MLHLNIAGIQVEVGLDQPHCCMSEISKHYDFSSYLSPNSGGSDLRVALKSSREISKPVGKFLMDEGISWIKKSACGGESCIYICRPGTGEILSLLEVGQSWDKAEIKYLGVDPNSIYAAAGPLGEILFRNNILFRQGMMMHASAVSWHKKGIVFCAPSGTGKSTQARLWRKYMGARVLNDDRAVIRFNDDCLYVYGTPWSGSSNDCSNGVEPLSAMVVLEQGSENTLRSMNRRDALIRLMPRCFLPYHSSELMELAISVLERIVTAVPVYLLRCKPDREAVELVYQCVK